MTTMVRFSCLYNHIHNSKESVQRPVVSMHETFQDCSCDQPQKDNDSKTLLLKEHNNNTSDTSAEKVSSSSSVDQCWKSEELMNNFSLERNMEVDLKRSQSVGTGLENEGKNSCFVNTEDETDQGLSYCDDFQEMNYERISEAYDDNELMESFDSKDPGNDLLHHYEEAPVVEKMHDETSLSVGDPENLDREGYEDSASHSGDYMHGNQPPILKSCSLSGMGLFSPVSSGGDSSSHVYGEPQSRSYEDLNALDARRKEFVTVKLGLHTMENEERNNKSKKDNSESPFSEGFDSNNVIGLIKDWKTPEIHEIDMIKNLQGDTSDEFPSKEFKMKRIEEWISMIDLEHVDPLLDVVESSCAPDEVMRDSKQLSTVTAARLDTKPTIGIDVAKHYISSLTAISTSAQLANHGLVIMPVLSAFVNLKVLNLSGNAIVRITAGCLPRGLHMLNLSKNNISTIEGLREHTRLRVLDLSFNRISRIGHGLASCSAMNELYLAGNKISEVEGLHRLLKLKILDMRFNKIATAKCFGQLASNYSSLQTVSVEGNPAQRNVGDEQVKKFLQGILPNLVCINKQPIRAGSSKEHTDRTSRSAITTTHQSYRGLRSEHKLVPKGSHKLATHKQSSSASHGRAMSSVKLGKARHELKETSIM